MSEMPFPFHWKLKLTRKKQQKKNKKPNHSKGRQFRLKYLETPFEKKKKKEKLNNNKSGKKEEDIRRRLSGLKAFTLLFLPHMFSFIFHSFCLAASAASASENVNRKKKKKKNKKKKKFQKTQQEGRMCL